MTMNSSGPISLGGSVTGQSINLEILQTATTQVSLNDSKVRTLAQVPSGQITMPANFWGKKYAANSAYYFMMGGGGNSAGAGGGQMIGQNTGAQATALSGTYTVVVGGAGASSSISWGATAIAGGTGPSYYASYCATPGNGACGAGAVVAYEAGACSPGTGYYGYGGGASIWGGFPNQDSLGGGGGGLGSPGGSANISYGSGAGGNGVTSSFNYAGSAIYYGGGTGGQPFICRPGVNCNIGANGAGVGPNTGGGGSSGIVIIRTPDSFPQCPTTGSPSIVQSGGYYWYTFNGSGTITF